MWTLISTISVRIPAEARRGRSCRMYPVSVSYTHLDVYKRQLAGYPRSSALIQGEMSERIIRDCGLSGKQVIAYMPVWRGAQIKKNFEIQLKIIYQYLSQIDRLLTDDQLFFVKLHPYVADAVDYSVYRHIRSFPGEYETYDFLSAADILVTDYSGVMFDFGVTGRKIILFTYDLSLIHISCWNRWRTK